MAVTYYQRIYDSTAGWVVFTRSDVTDAPSVGEGGGIAFSVVCSYSDLSTDDCTVAGGAGYGVSATSCATDSDI